MSDKENQNPDIEVVITEPDGKESRAKVDANSILPVDQVLPNKLPVIPIQGRPIFPGV